MVICPRILAVIVMLAFANLAHPAWAEPPSGSLSDLINLPPGFRVELYARVPEARTLVPAPELNAVFVGNRSRSDIYAIVDDNRDGKPNRVGILRRGLKSPNGLAWKNGYLYVAEQHRLIRFKGDSLAALADAKPEILYDRLPNNPWHGWRYAAFGPDGALYVAVGAPCNICQPQGLEGSIVRFDPETWQPEIYASGIRNSVGLAFQSSTGHLFFTDNGADHMGDDSPPGELNMTSGPGQWFGFPYFGGGDHRTPDFADQPLPRRATFPVVTFDAHVAPLGIRFYEGGMFPTDYTGDAFVAQHGSWNRTIPDGYRIVRIRFENGKAASHETFADGFLGSDGKAWGRPVDVQPLKDGSLLVSDDRQDAVYRITYDD